MKNKKGAYHKGNTIPFDASLFKSNLATDQ